jgi:type I restriction enzyme M protein
MLDTDTKRRIDTARDILVGKVPDPKSQVEQITIALIYKFMDDMDAEGEEWGGERRFFSGEFARYGWAKLMRSGLGGFETLNLYAEAIAKMPENAGIPPLFRDILKNAYLPYRDPETLRAFLKVIDEFSYDHSERLGDAFEYLLSVLGSQGDAGQFRTPRHIIDFMVEILDPKKSDTVLDPACGTGGFLISSYKHILRANTDAEGNNTLTPDEKARLAQNFTGYDISPDMVRLSLVNMYLHGFADPHIAEYDTLTSLERWNEHADVILANPPFMSPRGGIRPHNRFSVQSNRSEVLFVDYMAEHLKPAGRAAIIVPEGVVFQSQTAYTRLRKMLVDKFLVAVVSLPAGVFNPYSGVKTCILILDKSLAKKANTIGFFKIEADGFGLGAQRREIDRNDLPAAQGEIAEFLRRLRAGASLAGFDPTLGQVVERARIAAQGNYDLSAERFRTAVSASSPFPMVALGEVAELLRGITFAKSDQLERETEDSLRVVTTKAAQESGIVGDDLYHIPRSLLGDEHKLLRPGDILISTANSLRLLGRTTHVQHVDGPMSFGAFMSVIRPTARILDGYLIHCLRTGMARDFYLRSANTTTNISNLNLRTLAELRIPLPPLDVQREIAGEIAGYQRVIDGARAVVDNYRPHVPVRPEWPMVPLGEHFATASGGTPSKANLSFWKGQVPWVSPKDMKSDFIEDTQDHISEEAIEASATKLVPSGSVVCVVRSGILKHSLPVALLARDMCINQDLIAFRPTSAEVDSKFLLYVLKTNASSILEEGIKPGVTVQSFHNGFFRDYLIPVPPLAIQREIVQEIDAEQAVVTANRALIARFEKKIQVTLARIWGRDGLGQAES